MFYEIPIPLKQEHEELHEQLRSAIRADGEVGEAARTLAMLMHPNFDRDEGFALPPLALLRPLAQGGVTPEMAEVLKLTDRLEAELPAMADESRTIVVALARLANAAMRAGREDIVEFARKMTRDVLTDEQVVYRAVQRVSREVGRQLQEDAALSKGFAW